MARSFQQIIDGLYSDRIKERNDTTKDLLERLQTGQVQELERDASSVHNRRLNGTPWILLFEALFYCLKREKDDLLKKKTTAVEARFGATAALIKLVVVQTQAYLSKKDGICLIDNSLKSLRELRKAGEYEDVAKALVDALTAFVQVPHHIACLSMENWQRLVRMAFRTLLGTQDISIYTEPEVKEEGEEEEDYVDAGTPRKRRRADRKPAPRKRPAIHSVSGDQAACFPLLEALFRPSTSNTRLLVELITANEDEPTELCGSYVLTRLRVVLDIYPPASIANPYIQILLALLPHVALNFKTDVVDFAASTWRQLTSQWAGKSSHTKESLVSVFHILFPYFTASLTEGTPAVDQWIDDAQRSWDELQRHGLSKWSPLSLDSLRLDFVSLAGTSEERPEAGAFIAGAFRAGHNLTRAQAQSWTALLFQSDYAAKLFEIRDSASSYGRRPAKKARLNEEHRDPVTKLLSSLLSDKVVPSTTRVQELQLLLFLVDYHWQVLHAEVQEKVVAALSGIILSNLADSEVLSWTCVCIASVAHADSRSSLSPGKTFARADLDSMSIMWDSIWANTVRRANAANVCRAACHAARALLLHIDCHSAQFPSPPLDASRVLTDIENLAKDLDVQGPTYPHDSVCLFLAHCLQLTSRDMRLYRMQLEDKVLTWFVESWKLTRTDGQLLPSNNTRDILYLMETVCTFKRRSDVVSSVLLPPCDVVEVVEQAYRTSIIRNFLLHATLPKPLPMRKSPTVNELPAPFQGDQPFSEPSHRQRRLSIVTLQVLQRILESWANVSRDSNPSAVNVRRTLDVVVIILCFQALLAYNSIRVEKLVVQTAGKVLALLLDFARDTKWNFAEQAQVLSALEPLLSSNERPYAEEPFTDMVSPAASSGIKTTILHAMPLDACHTFNRRRSTRMDLQRMIWQKVEEPHIRQISETVRSILQFLCSSDLSLEGVNFVGSGIDEGDFAIRTSSGAQDPTEALAYVRSVADTCMLVLTKVPIVQSASGMPTRDKELIEMVLDSGDATFIFLCWSLFEQIRSKTLHVGLESLGKICERLDGLAMTYHHALDENFLMLVPLLIDSVFEMWCEMETRPQPGKALLRKVRDSLFRRKIGPWQVRDALTRLWSRFLVEDPGHLGWLEKDEEDTRAPDVMMNTMNEDVDIRVRWRAAVCSAYEFTFAQTSGDDPNMIYKDLRECLSPSLHRYELIVTRMICLANVMVISSAARRGAYWNLLEILLHESVHKAHFEQCITMVLDRASSKLGLTEPSALFHTYSSQLALALLLADIGVGQFPPHVFGHSDRKSFALAAFRSFTPVNLSADGNDRAKGRRQFKNHCTAVGLTEDEGIQECFGSIVGHRLTNLDKQDLDATLNDLWTVTRMNAADFKEMMQKRLDDVYADVLTSLSDYDVSAEGRICACLREMQPSGEIKAAFLSLVRMRRPKEFTTHQPNIPRSEALTLLQSLDWLERNFLQPDHQHALTYHVLQHLFTATERSVMINEQIRLLNALCLWVALQNTMFVNPTLLHVLMRGAVFILQQPDLALGAQSILSWAFNLYRSRAQTDPRFPDILIRISRISSDYTLSTNSELRALGAELGQWIDAEVVHVAQIQELEGQVLLTLPTWSRPLSNQLTTLYGKITAVSLTQTLASPRVSANKFHVVVHLRDHALNGDYGLVDTSASDFWLLKACIPDRSHLVREDVEAFAELLMWNRGYIDAFASNAITSTSMTVNTAPSSKLPIINFLLSMVTASDFSRRDSAYHTLRSLVSFNQGLRSFGDHKDEMRFLQIYTHSPNIAAARDIDELFSAAAFTSRFSSFAAWICAVGHLLSGILAQTDMFYAQLLPIISSDPTFAKQALPVLVQVLLQIASKAVAQKHKEALSCYFSQILSANDTDVESVHSIVDVVLYLRSIPLAARASDPLRYDKWLSIDYLLLARGAIRASAYTTALLFLELAAEYDESPLSDAATVEAILYDIYSNIDEPDGFYGIKPSNLTNFLLNRFHHERQWDKAFKFHGAALEAGSTNPRHVEGLLKSFNAFGFNSLATVAAQNSSTSTAGSIMTYSLGWRTGTWDIPDRHDVDSSEASLYHALRALHVERDQRLADTILERQLFCEMDRLRALGSENITQIRETIRNLLCLHQLSGWSRDPYPRLLSTKDTDLQKWAAFSRLDNGFDFTMAETIMATRLSIVQHAQKQESSHNFGRLVSSFSGTLKELERKSLLFISGLARSESQDQIALNSVIRAEGLTEATPFEVSEEFAKVLWSQNEERRAVDLLKELRIKKDHSKTTVAQINALLGKWTAKACLEKPKVIWNDFFIPAADATSAAQDMDVDSCASIYHSCALFAETQYYDIVRSPENVRLKVYIERREEEYKQRSEELQRREKKLKDLKQKPTPEDELLRSRTQHVRRLLEKDRSLFEQSMQDRVTFLHRAFDMYARCLEFSDDYDDEASIHLCSLWLANFDDDEVHKEARAAFDRVPSRKIVFLAHQLCARLSMNNSQNQQVLQDVVYRMCSEHPFHSLYQVYCLRTADGKDGTSAADRSSAAASIFTRLKEDARQQKRVADVELFCAAALEWATFPIKAKFSPSGGPWPVPQKETVVKTDKRDKVVKKPLLIQELRNRVHVPIMTVHTPIDRTGAYDDCVWLSHYDTQFSTAGGLNVPKIINCYDEKGKTYKQLFKGEGKDDLRQDAVMEQVFDVVNVVLARDRQTKRRDLLVRDYKVIPLSTGAGVLEFVDNTIPMRSWLASASGRYKKKGQLDINAGSAKLKVAQSAINRRTERQKLVEEWQEISAACPPVMRHYFTEQHKDPMAWFKMRLNYIRSVATTSIVGHVLGLGDRHTSNILLDKTSGELVHIDLGIAFDQGHYLPIPETVPFRMTSNIVDGMGISGTDGVFQRCAEETLRVLRDGRGAIMTILEVLKHDPLQSWTLSNYKAAKAQAEGQEAVVKVEEDLQELTAHQHMGIGITINSDNAAEAADRALSGVLRKLDSSLSVAATVSGLVAEAKDPDNLAGMFYGWMSHA